MRINKVTVRNYRILENLTVEFDNAITVIGGLNETGKSTLFEAIHRGLVLDPQAGGQVRESMKTAFADAPPEVTVEFTTGGTRYTAHKVFSGQTGRINLTAPGQPALNGEPAEKKLAQLLGMEELLGAQQKALDASFSMLFVRQGRSLEHSGEIIPPAGQLMELLQRDGSAGLLASEADLGVDKVVRQAVDGHYTQNRNQYRANSPAQAANDAFATAQAKATAAAANLAKLDTLAREIGEADRQLTESRKALEGLAANLSMQRDNLARALEARRNAELAEALAKAEEDKLANFNRSCDDLRAKSTELDRAVQEQAQRTTQLTAASARVRDNSSRLSDAQAEARLAEEAVSKARCSLAVAEAFVEAITAQTNHDLLVKQSADIRKLREERALLAATHESLMPLTKKAINDIRKLNENLVGLRAGRDAVATGITLNSASCGVTLDGKEIAVGERAIVTKEAHIAVGPHAVIQISPGGGKTLSDLEDAIREADKELDAKLEKLGAPNLAKAEELLASKEEAKRKMDGIDSTLGELIEDPEQFEEKLSKSVVALELAKKALEGLLEGMETPPKPDGADAARALVADGKVQLKRAETAERSARDSCEQIRTQSEGDIKTESTLRESISGHKARTDGLEGRIAELVRDLGDETQRQEQSSRLRDAATNLRRRAEACSQTATANNPDDIRLQIEALERDEVAESRRIDSAQKKRIANQTLLQANGVNDPHEEAALAMARQEEARLAFEAASGKASALLLLENLLTQQKKLINDRQAAPLVNRICGYLTPLFGPGATVEPVWDDKNAGFKTLRLFRPDRPKEGALAVEVLSGGAKEQVGAALRLALAELSLKARDEGITVVLDDAFVNTDSDRARKLMPMLLRASQKGIQVIILSCNPREYSGLGAARVDMPAPPVR